MAEGGRDQAGRLFTRALHALAAGGGQRVLSGRKTVGEPIRFGVGRRAQLGVRADARDEVVAG